MAEKISEVWIVVFQGIPQLAFTSVEACEAWLKFEAGKTLKDLDEEDHDGDYEYYILDLEHEIRQG